MSNVGDALSGGGTGASGISDTTLSDASLGDQLAGGTGDFGTGVGANAFGDAGGGGNSFSSFNDIANAFSGGGAGVGATPTAVQSASMTPPAAAGQTGGDPTGAAGGTQSNIAPGSTPTDQNQQQQSGGKQQQNPDYAPPSAVAQLKSLLKQLNSGKPAGPTGPTPQGGQNAPFALPTLAAGQTGGQSPGAGGLAALLGSQPAAASLPPLVPGETGAQSPQGAPPLEGGITNLPGVAPGQTGPQSPQGADPGRPAVDAQGNPVTAAGTPAADTPLPPARPGAQPTQTADAGGGGRQITVQKPGGGAQPSVDLPTRVPPGSAALPTKKPGASPAPAPAAPAGPATSGILRDISGVSTGSPTALADLAQAAKVIAPLIPLFAGLFGGGGRRGRFGGFHGGRFTHGFGGFGHLHGGQHPMGRGAWPYHHPQFGWHMHGRPPGPGWRPLHPTDAQGIVGGGMGGGQDPNNPNQDPNAPDPNAPPKETDAPVGPPSQTPTSGAIPGVGAKDVDDYTRSVATKWGIDPDVASKILAQESSYGQARKPGDNGTSFGPFQLHFAPDGRAMGDDFRRDTGLDPRDPKTWKDQVDYAMKRAAMGGWAPWTTTMNKLGLNQWSGITTNRRVASQLGPTRQTPAPGVASAAAMPIPAQLPPSSQPMVGG